MNTQEMGDAIATACEWTRDHNAQNDYLYRTKDGRGMYNPAADLNAMHEAEMSHVDLEDGHFVTLFREHLHTVLGHDGALAIHATAAQRAEAFLKTLGLWTP